MTGHLLKALLGGVVALTVVLATTLAAANPDTTVEAGSASLAPGDSALVPITVRGVPADTAGLAAYQLEMSFDPRVVQVDSVAGGDAPFEQLAAVKIDNDTGFVVFNNFVVAASYPAGDVVVAKLAVRAAGAPGQATSLHFDGIELVGGPPENRPIPATGVHGVVRVSGAAAGAEFFATPASGVAPVAIGFSDLSSGGPTAWQWSFGDGATSAEQNPVHVYQLPGTYTVSLTVTGPSGQSSQTKQDHITVVAPATPTPTPGPTATPTPRPTATPVPTAAPTGVPGATATPAGSPMPTPPNPPPPSEPTPTPSSDELVLAGGAVAWPQLVLAAGGLGVALLGLGLYLTWKARRL